MCFRKWRRNTASWRVSLSNGLEKSATWRKSWGKPDRIWVKARTLQKKWGVSQHCLWRYSSKLMSHEGGWMSLETFFDFAIYSPRRKSTVDVEKVFSLPLSSFRVIVWLFFFFFKLEHTESQTVFETRRVNILQTKVNCQCCLSPQSVVICVSSVFVRFFRTAHFLACYHFPDSGEILD